MLRHLHIFLSLVLLFCSGWLTNVDGQYLTVIGSPGEREVLDRYTVLSVRPDSLEVRRALSQLVSDLQQDGYFQASATRPTRVDSLRWNASVTAGPRYEWAYLSPGNLDPVMQEKSGFRERFFLNRPFAYRDIRKLMEKVLTVSENDGFPFASIRLVDVGIKNGQVQARIDYQPGPYITFGPLQIHGTDKVKPGFLASQLRIREGSAYSEEQVNRINRLVRNLPHLELSEPVSVSFQNDEAEVHLSLSERETDQVDALLNFLPNENEPGSLLMTGQASISLNNLMRSGKHLSLQWRRLQLETQQLALAYRHPYLFKSPLEAGVAFRLLKEDTLFLNRSFNLQISYPLSNGGKLALNTELHDSRHLSENPVIDMEGRGPIADFNLINTQFSLKFSSLDDVVFPTQGTFVSGSLGMGRKTLRNTLGEQEQSQFWQPSACLTLQNYLRISELWVVYHRLTGAFVYSEALFLNELYRLGGLRSLRGFNDNFFFAAYYTISNLEVRLLLEQTREAQSYLYAFYDQGFLGHTLAGNAYRDLPTGLGAGLSLSTRGGIFSLAYALGRTQSTGFDLALSKIHFGYISIF